MCNIKRIDHLEILGIKFAPLNTPLHRRLQTLVVGFGLSFIFMGAHISAFLLLYILLFTNFGLLPILYLVWIWVFDKKVCERGGRRFEWVRNLPFWKYFKEYFPITMRKDSDDVGLDPKRNYLFCSFPHGLLATGVFAAFGTKVGGFEKLFPKHTPHILTLKQNFAMPLIRDFLLACGMSAASARSINYLMGSPKGSNAALLVVGGAAESFYCKPGEFRLVLKNRKGFVKLALLNGSPLVPVFSFGETDIYNQVNNPEGSLLRSIQERVKTLTGVVPIIPLGRGFFQYSFGVIPYRKPINIIVGKPIDVEKFENPTQQQIDILHETFIKQLTELFDRHKYSYLKNPDKTSLIIV